MEPCGHWLCQYRPAWGARVKTLALSIQYRHTPEILILSVLPNTRIKSRLEIHITCLKTVNDREVPGDLLVIAACIHPTNRLQIILLQSRISPVRFNNYAVKKRMSLHFKRNSYLTKGPFRFMPLSKPSASWTQTIRDVISQI